MTRLICLLFILIVRDAFAQQYLLKHQWTATLKVVDQTGQPVAGAKAGVGNGISKLDISGFTGTNGIFVASHSDAVENLAFYAEKPGYYPFYMTYNKGNYNPQKWNPTLTIILKRIIDPIAMYAKSVNLGMIVYEKPAGFDLAVGDWVAPFGKGVTADFIFTGHRETNSQGGSDFKLTVSFPNPGDGLQEFSSPVYYLGSRGSVLRSSEQTPADGYQATWIQTISRRPGKLMESNYNRNRNYYFRVRTVLDHQGNIVSTHYGKIYGDFMQFTYYLNPTPNSRDVEFDTKQNLIKNLKSYEQVTEP